MLGDVSRKGHLLTTNRHLGNQQPSSSIPERF